MKLRLYALLTLLACVPALLAESPDWAPSSSDKPIKVFILAGQSNMEGRGFPEPLTWQVTQPEFRERWTHFIQDGDYEAFTKQVEASRNPDDKRAIPEYRWSTRQDCWINYLGKHGDLTVGYGAPREGFGPEFDVGHKLADHYDEQVLIIKTSWGGRALARGFLPPSSRLSDDAYDQAAAELRTTNESWNREQKAKIDAFNSELKTKSEKGDGPMKSRTFRPRPLLTNKEYREQFGKDYRNMIKEVHDCLANIKVRFPGYRNQGYEMVGFIWFQGWNDQYEDRWLSYETNLANLIRDVRAEFDAPEMKVVVGQMGHDGMKEDRPDSPRDYIKKAQAKVPALAEFKGNAVCVRTDAYWDLDAHAIYTSPGSWSKDIDRWRQHGNDRGYHYYGSPWTFSQIGRAFGDAMVELLRP